jgi:hypothetical protein
MEPGLLRQEKSQHTSSALPAYPGLLLKDSYWRWPQRNLGGNAIFFMRVLRLAFHDAMHQITAP